MISSDLDAEPFVHNRRHFAVVIATELRQDISSAAEHLEAMRPVAATGAHIVVVQDDPGVSPDSTACAS